MTNLELAQLTFPKADFELNTDTYRIDNGYMIEWIESELFIVSRTYLDLDVGYVTDDNLFSGNFIECLNYIKKNTMGD